MYNDCFFNTNGTEVSALDVIKEKYKVFDSKVEMDNYYEQHYDDSYDTATVDALLVAVFDFTYKKGNRYHGYYKNNKLHIVDVTNKVVCYTINDDDIYTSDNVCFATTRKNVLVVNTKTNTSIGTKYRGEYQLIPIAIKNLITIAQFNDDYTGFDCMYIRRHTDGVDNLNRKMLSEAEKNGYDY
jgi:hypothetical protein